MFIIIFVPNSKKQEELSFFKEISFLKNADLWAAYLTSGLIIGSAFCAFTYFSPIFLNEVKIEKSFLPWVFVFYGIATVVGNYLVGRFCDKFTMQIMFLGLSTMVLVLITMALNLDSKNIAIICAILVGFAGVS